MSGGSEKYNKYNNSEKGRTCFLRYAQSNPTFKEQRNEINKRYYARKKMFQVALKDHSRLIDCF